MFFASLSSILEKCCELCDRILLERLLSNRKNGFDSPLGRNNPFEMVLSGILLLGHGHVMIVVSVVLSPCNGPLVALRNQQ